MKNSRLIKRAICLLILLFTTFIPSFGKIYAEQDYKFEVSTSIKKYLTSVKKKAIQWQSDAILVWMDNNVVCDSTITITGWNLIFYSKTESAYYQVSACGDNIEGKETGKVGPSPTQINQDFIDPAKVALIVSDIAQRWELGKYTLGLTLRMVGNEPKDADFPKKKLLWEISCFGESGDAVIFIDATSGKILKKYQCSFKGGD